MIMAIIGGIAVFSIFCPLIIIVWATALDILQDALNRNKEKW